MFCDVCYRVGYLTRCCGVCRCPACDLSHHDEEHVSEARPVGSPDSLPRLAGMESRPRKAA